MSRKEILLVAWAEPASGPGWSNRPIRALVEDIATGAIRQIWIQPEDQTMTMYTLYDINAASTSQMTKAVANALNIR